MARHGRDGDRRLGAERGEQIPLEVDGRESLEALGELAERGDQPRLGRARPLQERLDRPCPARRCRRSRASRTEASLRGWARTREGPRKPRVLGRARSGSRIERISSSSPSSPAISAAAAPVLAPGIDHRGQAGERRAAARRPASRSRPWRGRGRRGGLPRSVAARRAGAGIVRQGPGAARAVIVRRSPRAPRSSSRSRETHRRAPWRRPAGRSAILTPSWVTVRGCPAGQRVGELGRAVRVRHLEQLHLLSGPAARRQDRERRLAAEPRPDVAPEVERAAVRAGQVAVSRPIACWAQRRQLRGDRLRRLVGIAAGSSVEVGVGERVVGHQVDRVVGWGRTRPRQALRRAEPEPPRTTTRAITARRPAAAPEPAAGVDREVEPALPRSRPASAGARAIRGTPRAAAAAPGAEAGAAAAVGAVVVAGARLRAYARLRR